MSFDRDLFSELLDDIETEVGYLKGNELALDYIRRVKLDNEDPAKISAGSVHATLWLDADYRFPCPKDRWRVQPVSNYRSIDVHVHSDPDNPPPEGGDAFIKEVQANADKAWHDGATWASGLADYGRSICEQFIAPDADIIAGNMIDLKMNVIDELRIARGDWADLADVLEEWHGTSAHSFRKFYDHYADTMDIFAGFTAYMLVGFSAAAQTIHGTQVGAMKFIRSLREGLDAELDSWVTYGLPPLGSPPPPWVADVSKIAHDAYNVAGHVPVVKDAKSEVDNAVGAVGACYKLLSDIADVTGHHLPSLTKDVPTKSANDIYNALTDTLYTDYYKAFDDVLTKLYTGDIPQQFKPKKHDKKHHGKDKKTDDVPDPEDYFSGKHVLTLMNETKGRYDWSLNDVPDQSLWDPVDKYDF